MEQWSLIRMDNDREFSIGLKGTTVYAVKGLWLNRLDLIYHLLCWARDNKQHGYPQQKLLEFLIKIIEFGYSSIKNVTEEEAEKIAHALENDFFCDSRKTKLKRKVEDFV